MSGNLDQVLAAFDMISELLHQSPSIEGGATLQSRLPDVPMQIHLLLEHQKAGKAVGTKGTMMQTMKMKSGASSIRIEKEPMVPTSFHILNAQRFL